jgi:hypothetical protein
MRNLLTRPRRAALAPLAALALAVGGPAAATAQAGDAGGLRPMTFLDVQHLRTLEDAAPSPDGRIMLHTVSTPDWEQARSQTDIYAVWLDRGVESSRQLTFTKEKNETQPTWSRDGSFFVFLSNRDAPSNSQNQQPALPDAARWR